MSAQLKDLIDKCSICQSVKPEQASKPLQPHPVPDRPWQLVATFENRNYLVLVDYYSNFIELDYLANTSSQTVLQVKRRISDHIWESISEPPAQKVQIKASLLTGSRG